MFEWMTNVVQSLGALGVAFLMFLENIFPPIPSELVMPLAGFVAARGEMSFWPMVLAGAAGSMVLLYIVRLVRQNRTRGAESKKDASSHTGIPWPLESVAPTPTRRLTG